VERAYKEVSFMIEAAIILTFISVTGLVYYFSAAWITKKKLIKTRLERLKPPAPWYNQLETDLARPLIIRLFEPVVKKLSGVVLKLTPVNMRNQTEHLLESAGHPWNLNVNEYLVLKMLVSIGFPLLVYFTTGTSNPPMGLISTGASFLVALIIPDFRLKRLVKARQLKVLTSLPDALDLLTVSVEAGLGFDQALLKLAEKTKGPLTEEFKRVLQEIRIGKTRRDALREMSVRTGVEDLQNFVVAIIQADQLGVGIGNVLRIQSQQLRQKRRLKAEERAQKAPIKMLIPMIIFIFPCLFIILLGPGVLQLIDNFVTMKR
jgi:tight adherence protein C